NVQIDKAVDDTGADLATPPDGEGLVFPPSEVLQEPTTTPPEIYPVDLMLPRISSRKATALTLVSGTVSVVAGGEKKRVEIRNIIRQTGRPIDDPALKAAG